MPVVGAAAVTAGGVVVAGHIAGKHSDRAAKITQESGREALEYQKGRDSVEDARYKYKQDLYQRYLDDYRARNGGGTAASGGGGVSAAPVSIADLMAGQQAVGDATANPQAAMQGQSMADAVSGWNDWRRYGA